MSFIQLFLISSDSFDSFLGASGEDSVFPESIGDSSILSPAFSRNELTLLNAALKASVSVNFFIRLSYVAF